MEPYLIITELNDFIFCPRSIYFHKLYGKYSERIYKQKPQIVGTINHEKLEQKTYSTKKKDIQSLAIFSEKYRLCGKIDLYDSKTKTLIERKTKIKKIYDGYRYQLWAQYFCMQEMGYKIEKLVIRSLEDNKKYFIPLPSKNDILKFEELLQKIKNFDPHHQDFSQNSEKCQNCIYANLCDSDNS
jgi:CRISPR-associated protein Cas4